MIDTDKYEGHTPAPWLNHNPDDPLAHRHDQCDFMVGTYQKSKNGSMYFKLIADWGGCVNCLPDANSVIAEYPDWANARLIADAPLLLEEVKRLREEISRLNKWEDNVREFFGYDAMIDFYDMYGDEEE
jgi:hypothetical protein